MRCEVCFDNEATVIQCEVCASINASNGSLFIVSTGTHEDWVIQAIYNNQADADRFFANIPVDEEPYLWVTKLNTIQKLDYIRWYSYRHYLRATVECRASEYYEVEEGVIMC